MTTVTELPVKTPAQSILQEAKKEVVEARAKDAKNKLKTKLAQIESAKLVVANLERELEVIMEQVNAELDV